MSIESVFDDFKDDLSDSNIEHEFHKLASDLIKPVYMELKSKIEDVEKALTHIPEELSLFEKEDKKLLKKLELDVPKAINIAESVLKIALKIETVGVKYDEKQGKKCC